jgi:hypothetical protein
MFAAPSTNSRAMMSLRADSTPRASLHAASERTDIDRLDDVELIKLYQSKVAGDPEVEAIAHIMGRRGIAFDPFEP